MTNGRLTRSGSKSTFEHSNHPSNSLLSTASIEYDSTDEMNLSSGESLGCLTAIVTEDQIDEVRKRIHEDMNNCKLIEDQLKASSRLLAGILFKYGSSRLWKTVFDICRENIRDKRKQAIDKMKKRRR